MKDLEDLNQCILQTIKVKDIEDHIFIRTVEKDGKKIAERVDTTQDANLDEVKYCGFSKCPNRYAYITRPEVLAKVFNH